MEFRNYLEEQELLESAGNLKGMPTKFIKELTKTYDGLAGKDSEVQLWKKNAKQRDVTAATRMCGGWVKPGDRGYRRYSKEELQAKANKENFAGVVIKINGEWAFMASWEEVGQDGGNFKIIDAAGKAETVKRYKQSIRGYGKDRHMEYWNYDSQYLKASEISDIIDFKDDIVDVYVVTTDPNRILKRQERAADKVIAKVSPTKKKAIVKFLDSKSGGIISQADERLQALAKKISDGVSGIISSAIQGKEKSIDTKKLTDQLTKEIESANSLAYYIRDIVKTGNIKETSWGNNGDTWAYKKFKELVKQMNDKEL